ncbi:MAG TPA: pyrimidine dimer DNA glycosylase/endonuclease V [Gemmatimonadaceae bacterium]|nr:pyrimidine dimer DNA glycosylase/endonuclease V [Gemmatimonadaceae bacterium]
MRLWSLHPRYLDARGLVALWREALLARAVLHGTTKGYTKHPQLERFVAHESPRDAINAYLAAVHAEAVARGYAFDATKIGPVRPIAPIPVTRGQLAYEWQHLLRKLSVRSPELYRRLRSIENPACHPVFRCRAGSIASWERALG